MCVCVCVCVDRGELSKGKFIVNINLPQICSNKGEAIVEITLAQKTLTIIDRGLLS